MKKKFQMRGFTEAVNSHISQPRIDLPISIEDIVKTDSVILTHNHSDHRDEIAEENHQKDIPFFVRNAAELKIIQENGITNLKIIDENGTNFEGIKMYKTETQHGARETVKPYYERINRAPYGAMGVVFQSENNKAFYY